MKTNLLILFTSLSIAFGQQPPLPPGTNPPPPPAAPPNAVPGDPFVKGTTDAPKRTRKPAGELLPITNYQVVFETFDLSRENFVALLDEAGDDVAKYRRIVEWISAGRAKLASFTAITTKSGNRTALNSADEVLYATEFDGPNAEDDIVFPNGFEARNAGESLELEMVVTGDQEASIQIAPQFTRLVKFTDESAHQGSPTSAVSQPRFETRKLTTNLTLTMNQPRMAGTLSVSGETGTNTDEIRVAFLTVRPNVLSPAKVEAVTSKSKLIRLEYSFFSLDRTAARELWLAKPDPQSCFDALRKMASEKKARLEHASVNVTQTGNRTVTEEIQEKRYGTELMVPRIPWNSEPVKPVKTPSPNPRKPQDPPPTVTATATSEIQPPLSDWPKKSSIPAFYTTFYVRNIGFISEVEPSVSEDGAIVDMSLALQFIRDLGPLEVTGIGKFYPQQPLFESRKITGSFAATVGQQQFISTFNLPNGSGVNGRKDDGRVWLGFVRSVLVK